MTLMHWLLQAKNRRKSDKVLTAHSYRAHCHNSFHIDSVAIVQATAFFTYNGDKHLRKALFSCAARRDTDPASRLHSTYRHTAANGGIRSVPRY